MFLAGVLLIVIILGGIYGLNLVVTAGFAGMSVMAVVRAALPFLFAFLIIVTLCREFRPFFRRNSWDQS